MNNRRRQIILGTVGCCVALVGLSLYFTVLDHRSHTALWWMTTFGDPAQRGWERLQPRVAVLKQVAVASTLVAGDSNSVCHLVTFTQSGGGTSTTSSRSYDLAPGTELASVVVLTATNGLYKLNQPLTVGTRNGRPMRLVVGSWNWEQLSLKK